MEKKFKGRIRSVAAFTFLMIFCGKSLLFMTKMVK